MPTDPPPTEALILSNCWRANLQRGERTRAHSVTGAGGFSVHLLTAPQR
jgi:hypothetical protein